MNAIVLMLYCEALLLFVLILIGAVEARYEVRHEIVRAARHGVSLRPTSSIVCLARHGF